MVKLENQLKNSPVEKIDKIGKIGKIGTSGRNDAIAKIWQGRRQ